MNAGAIRSLKLYHCPATRSARARWALHETIGDAFEIVPVDLYAGEQYRRSYVARNPNHNVPLLEVEFDDGEALNMTESAAIVSWLADAFPEARLAPPPGPTARRADYCRILQFGASPMDMMLWQIRVHEHLLADGVRDEKTAARYRAKFRAEIEPQLAARLEKGAFVCGDEFTAADIVIGHNVGWARAYDLCSDGIFSQYQGRLAARPAFRKAFSDIASFSVVPPQPPRPDSPFNG